MRRSIESTYAGLSRPGQLLGRLLQIRGGAIDGDELKVPVPDQE